MEEAEAEGNSGLTVGRKALFNQAHRYLGLYDLHKKEKYKEFAG